MPRKLKSPCAHSQCPALVEAGERFCEKHRKAHYKQQDRDRGSASERGYDARWRRARRMYLRENPLCAECLKEGRTEAATVVDHIIPHKGDYEMFWDSENWQPLCVRHHGEKTAKETWGGQDVHSRDNEQRHR